MGNTIQNLEMREETLYNRENEGLQGYLQLLKTLIQKYPKIR